jgi:N-methylhydantoinase A
MPHDITLQGPAVIEQMDATTVVPPKAGITVDQVGNIMVQLPIEGKTV